MIDFSLLGIRIRFRFYAGRTRTLLLAHSLRYEWSFPVLSAGLIQVHIPLVIV